MPYPEVAACILSKGIRRTYFQRHEAIRLRKAMELPCRTLPSTQSVVHCRESRNPDIAAGVFKETKNLIERQPVAGGIDRLGWRVRKLLHAGDGWKAQYFSDAAFGNLVATRIEPTLDFTWGTATPDPAITPGRWSARFTGWLFALHDETYTFTRSPTAASSCGWPRPRA